ncbi:MAG: Glu-tRNA(Gln) amidotransferase subunit GatE [Promethearchaeota archaeon]
MNSKEEYDYKKLGLKVGIEIHQQLDTKGKLFCRCPNKLIQKPPDFKLIRTFRPVLGEEGKFDKAMLLEFKKKTIVEYEGYYDYNCTYEYDETPPFECDKESLEIALEIAMLLNLNIVDELHICRKNYVDGSVPAGFQRTMIVGIDGLLPLSEKKSIGIELLCLEEDACKKISQKGNKVVFRLDRLGVPLVEIATAPDLNTPEEARIGAERIGLLLRGTGRVKKQLGATRQDINVSIMGGNRIEIKGVQKLDWIPPLVKNEVRRQLALIKIKEEMKKRNITKENIQQDPIDVTSILKNTMCKFINKGIKAKQKVWALKVPKMKGLWGIEVQENRRFGTEVANKIRVITGLKGLIHSDEDLKKYNLSNEEINSIRNKLQCNENDLFVLIMGSASKLKDAIEIIIKRVSDALDGVPPETRRALENGNNEFLRDLHGGARLYPDTDSREIRLEPTFLKEIRKKLPKYPWDLIKEDSKTYNLPPETIKELLLNGFLFLFKKIMQFHKGKSTLVATILLEMTKSLRRDGFEVDYITDKHYIDIFKALNDNKIAKEAIEPILQYISKNPEDSVENAIKKIGIKTISIEKLENIVQNIIPKFTNLIKERGMGAMGPVMGAVMKEVRGKIDGKTVNAVVKKHIQKIASNNANISTNTLPQKNSKKNPKNIKKKM